MKMKVRNVEAHLLEDKMDEAVTHYINTHPANEPVHIDTNGIPMTVQDDGAGRVTVMHQQTYTTQMCRQVSVTEQVGDGPWGEELLEGPIAAIVAHLQNSRHHPPPLHKVAQVRTDVDTSVILDGTMRFTGHTLEQQTEPIVVQLPPMQSLPPLQDMKRCADADWFTDKNKKDEQSMLQDSDSQVLEMGAGASPALHKQQSRKSLPHKKRISRKLKRNNGNSTPQQELVVINCSESVRAEGGGGGGGGGGEAAVVVAGVGVGVGGQEQILPDTYVTVPHHAAHISHEVRPMFICQICGDYYGEEQLKFYHHLKQHYEPHATIIIENPVPDLAMDKMTSNCIVDNVATLPDSIVELSLENTVPKTMYQPIDKHILYTSTDKSLTYNTNKVQYSMASIDKEPVHTTEVEKSDLYETLDKFDLYNCGKCSKTFRKQKQCEAHMREAHSSNTKLEDMGEFSEPEDLMAGIQVCVEETYEPTLLPHLTIDNGHVTQEHTRHWYRGGGAACGAGAGAGGFCAECVRPAPLRLLKEEVLQRIFDGEVSDNANFADNMMPDHDVGEQEHDHEPDHDHEHDHGHEHNEHSHEIDDHTHRNLDHNLDHGHDHNSHSQGINEQSHMHNSHEHIEHHENDHNEHGHHQNDHNELGLQQNEHNENGHHQNDHNDHGHHQNDHNEHGHHQNDHNEHGHHQHDHNEHSQEPVSEQILKQEVIRKEDIEPGETKKQFECTECDRVFTHRNSLLYHALSHGEKQHVCRECGKGFYTVGALKIHLRVHNGLRPYKCAECARDFRQWSDLKYHMISLHTDKKHFKCEFCGKEFARKYSLNVHVRIHTGEKNYRCEFCNKTFRASSYRRTHMKIHTGERPYKCEECSKGFRSGFDLRRHMLVHDKMRNRFDEDTPAPKENNKKPKMIDTKEEKLESPPKRIKQIALASTTRLPNIMKKSQKKKAPKKGAPNVTVQNRDGFKINEEYPYSVQVYDNRQDYSKFKNITNESEGPFKGQILYKDEQSQQRNLAVLRPFRSPTLEQIETEKINYRTENTDGKMQVFTHVEKSKEYSGSIVSNSQVLGDIRHLEREVAREVRGEVSGEGIETAFLERLTAMYNIPAV